MLLVNLLHLKCLMLFFFCCFFCVFAAANRPAVLSVYQEFDRLLEEQLPIEAYIEWLDSMVDRCVVKVSKKSF